MKLDMERVRATFHEEYASQEQGCRHGALWDCTERFNEFMDTYSVIPVRIADDSDAVPPLNLEGLVFGRLNGGSST